MWKHWIGLSAILLIGALLDWKKLWNADVDVWITCHYDTSIPMCTELRRSLLRMTSIVCIFCNWVSLLVLRHPLLDRLVQLCTTMSGISWVMLILVYIMWIRPSTTFAFLAFPWQQGHVDRMVGVFVGLVFLAMSFSPIPLD